MLTWEKLPDVMGLEMWGAIAVPFQYVLSYDPLSLEFCVSVKVYPNVSRPKYLGIYMSKEDAQLACETHYSNNVQ